MKKIRVLITDDSTVIRRLLSETLASDPEIEVVGTAANGKIALAKIPLLKPDVITLDIEMPVMDGLETLPELRKLDAKLPVIMFSTLTSRGAQATFEALARGASDYVAKPANVGSVTESIQSVKDSLLPKIKGLCPWYETEKRRQFATPQSNLPGAIPRSNLSAIRLQPPKPARKIDIVAIGASTGGPNALQTVLTAIPAEFPVPIVITQHMPPVFTKQLANRLDHLSAIDVVEAEDGMPVIPGQAILAQGNFHLTLIRRNNELVVKLNSDAAENSCRPAVDVMFRSVASLFGGNSLGVVLTGMGQDGKLGCEQLQAVGAQVLAQDQASSIVWGMPRAVAENGLADAILPLDRIANEITGRVLRMRSSKQAIGSGGMR